MLLFLTYHALAMDHYHTLAGYRTLKEEEKYLLRKNACKKLTISRFFCIPRYHPTVQPQWLPEHLPRFDWLAIIRDMAQECILDTYSRDIIVGIGQSPAYLVAAAKILKQMKGTLEDPEQFKHLAFSGKWHEVISTRYQIKQEFCFPLKIFFPSTPNKKQVKAYRDYLASMDLTPQTILGRFNEEKKKTLFIDYTVSTASLKSFVSLLTEWIREERIDINEIKEALHFMCLQNPYTYGGNATVACDPFEVVKYIFEEGTMDPELLRALAEADGFNDRLVPYHPFSKWEKQDPNVYELSENSKLCLFNIIDYLLCHT
jgi:hypothetical protein